MNCKYFFKIVIIFNILLILSLYLEQMTSAEGPPVHLSRGQDEGAGGVDHLEHLHQSERSTGVT